MNVNVQFAAKLSYAELFRVNVIMTTSMATLVTLGHIFTDKEHKWLIHMIILLEVLWIVLAVSVVIVKLNVKDYDKIKCYFSNFCDQCQNEAIKSIAEKLKEYKHYFMIEPLVSFLSKQVETGLKELLNKEDISDICSKLRRSYKNIKSGDFSAFRDFVEGRC